jgi:hypothetical protein
VCAFCEQDCIFMRSFGRRTTDDVRSVLVVAESLVRRLIRPIILILIIGKLNGQQPKLLRTLPMAWYKRGATAASADLALAERCLNAEPLAVSLVAWR